MHKFHLIIPAAGIGKRSGGTRPKQYVEIAGQPMLRWTTRAFAEMSGCGKIIIAINPEWKNEAEEAVHGIAEVIFVEGGNERQDSIHNALERLGGEESVVLVHDAARPLVSHDLIDRVVTAARDHEAAIPVLPIPETVKRIADGKIIETIPRSELATAQTPQGFHLSLLREAYAQAAEQRLLGTDDASLVEALGKPVVTVPGDPLNLKVTWPEDFDRAAYLLQTRGKQREEGAR